MIKNLPESLKEKTLKNYIFQNESIKGKIKDYVSNRKSLFIYGKPGTGKSHLAAGILKAIKKIEIEKTEAEKVKERLEELIEYFSNPPEFLKQPSGRLIQIFQERVDELKNELESGSYKIKAPKIIFVNFVNLIFELGEAIASNKSKNKIYKSLANDYDIIFIDDFGAEKKTEATIQNIYHLINIFYENKKKLLITSNFNLDYFYACDPRLGGRLKDMCDEIYLNSADFRLGGK